MLAMVICLWGSSFMSFYYFVASFNLVVTNYQKGGDCKGIYAFNLLFWYLVNTRLERTKCLNQVHLQIKFSLPLYGVGSQCKKEKGVETLKDRVWKSATW
jgi:hypothetical protein